MNHCILYNTFPNTQSSLSGNSPHPPPKILQITDQ
uniref:Uncharacterized protein n=1 Tax=Anguilla anguilla TaxID=7936 RepID=A0A0E9U3W7_ANGAN